MIPETIVTRMVRDQAERLLPGETAAADSAVQVARRALAGGLSQSEARRAGYSYLGSRLRHPSHQRPALHLLAS